MDRVETPPIRDSPVAGARYIGRFRLWSGVWLDPTTSAVRPLWNERPGYHFGCYETDERDLFDIYLEPNGVSLGPGPRYGTN